MTKIKEQRGGNGKYGERTHKQNANQDTEDTTRGAS